MYLPPPHPKQMGLFGREIESGQWRRELLARLDLEGATDLADRLRQCGLDYRLYCKSCGYLHMAATKCNRKWCPSCAPKRANDRASKLRHAIRQMRWPLQLTLTMRNVPLEDAPRTILRSLMQSYARLRRTKLWTDNVRGGIVSVEVTDKGNGLHPHLHSVVDCEWLALTTPRPHRGDDIETLRSKFAGAARELQGAWARCLGQEEPPRLWIRRCDAGAAAEIVKYALKSEDAINCQGAVAPILRMLDAVRTVATFGTLRGLKIIEPQRPSLKCPNGHDGWTSTPPGRVATVMEHRLSHRQRREIQFIADLAAWELLSPEEQQAWRDAQDTVA